MTRNVCRNLTVIQVWVLQKRRMKMNFEVISVEYREIDDYSREGMAKYLNSIHENGFNNAELLVPDSDEYPNKFKISIILNDLGEFVKLISVLGKVVFDGSQITIYDDYIE